MRIVTQIVYCYSGDRIDVKTFYVFFIKKMTDNSSYTVTTRGIQKVRSLIQLTKEYEHDILSLVNIVPFNRNALGPAILQSPYSIVEEFLILVPLW